LGNMETFSENEAGKKGKKTQFTRTGTKPEKGGFKEQKNTETPQRWGSGERMPVKSNEGVQKWTKNQRKPKVKGKCGGWGGYYQRLGGESFSLKEPQKEKTRKKKKLITQITPKLGGEGAKKRENRARQGWKLGGVTGTKPEE